MRLARLALAALALAALVACGGATPPEPTPATPAAPTADPREADVAAPGGLDLRDLPTLPVTATGERRATALLYETTAGVAEGVAFYRAELGARGWRERADEGYIQTNTGLLVVAKDGALLSISVSDLGASRVVQLRHHGVADAAALPRYPGAEVIFERDAQLIYVTDATVSDVAAFTGEALAAEGWLTYRRPFTAYADDPSFRAFTLTRDGASLAANVAVSPGQGGRTTVQYVLDLMPVALPLAPDAAELLLDPDMPYASYTTALGQDEVLGLYRSGMAGLGWREERGAARAGPDGAALLFLRDEEEAALELRAAGGRTAVLLSPPGEDADPASAEATEIALVEATAGAGAPAGAAIPIPTGAYEVEADADDGPAGSLRASSSFSVEVLLAFYRAALAEQGWAERPAEGEIDARRARLVFTRPGAVLRLELRQMADGATAIRVETARE